MNGVWLMIAVLHWCSFGQVYLPVCVFGRLEHENAMLSRVMYLIIMEANGVCAFIKRIANTAMIIVLGLVSRVFVLLFCCT